MRLLEEKNSLEENSRKSQPAGQGSSTGLRLRVSGGGVHQNYFLNIYDTIKVLVFVPYPEPTRRARVLPIYWPFLPA